MISATSSWTDKIMEYVYGESYYRVPEKSIHGQEQRSIILNKEDGEMDNGAPHHVNMLIKKTEEYIIDNKERIKEICSNLHVADVTTTDYLVMGPELIPQKLKVFIYWRLIFCNLRLKFTPATCMQSLFGNRVCSSFAWSAH